MRSLILILNLIMIVALILTWSSSLLTIHRLAQIVDDELQLVWAKAGTKLYDFANSVPAGNV